MSEPTENEILHMLVEESHVKPCRPSPNPPEPPEPPPELARMAALFRSSVRSLRRAHGERLAAPAAAARPNAFAAARRGLSGDAQAARLEALEAQFKADVAACIGAEGALQCPGGRGLVVASAWLATDNAMCHLFKQQAPEVFEGMSIAAVDTLHLFPETRELMDEVQAFLGKEADVFFPNPDDDPGRDPRGELRSRAAFERAHGECLAMDHADFDQWSKVEPFSRGLAELGKRVLARRDFAEHFHTLELRAGHRPAQTLSSSDQISAPL